MKSRSSATLSKLRAQSKSHTDLQFKVSQEGFAFVQARARARHQTISETARRLVALAVKLDAEREVGR